MKRFEIDLSKDFVHLPSAPIVEAVIHWTARSVNPLKDQLLQLKALLPDYPNHQQQHQLEFQSQVNTDGIIQGQKTNWHGFRFESKDKRNIAQYTRNGFVFSRLAPYEDWERFSKEANRLWQIYVDVADPLEVQRLGIRFINRMILHEMDELNKYMVGPPKCPNSFQLPIHEFVHQYKLDVPGYPYNVNVTQTIQPQIPQQNEGFGLILDIDVFTTKPPRMDKPILDACLQDMRLLKNEAFFSFLTPDAIEIFKGESS